MLRQRIALPTAALWIGGEFRFEIRVQDLGLRVQGSGFKGLRFRVYDLEFRI